jgi:uncharacterized protein YkwD
VIRLALSLTVIASTAAADPVPGAAEALNGLRAQVDAPPLVLSPQLQAAAEAHGRDMVTKGYFDHKGRDGSSIATRVKREGYRYCFAAENIARGQKSLNDVMGGWAMSPGHRKNMLSKEAREFGLARVGTTWVMVLGRSGC